MRDYQQWHRQYDDPASGLSWRLAQARGYLRDELDRTNGPRHVVSAGSGDGRDLLGVLSGRPDADRVHATLIEFDPQIADDARTASADLPRVTVRTADAGHTEAYRDAVPADIVLLVGVFGNVSDADLDRTIDATPQLCAAGALLVWSRSIGDVDRNDGVAARFAGLGFDELDYAAFDGAQRPALGALRFTGEPRALVAGRRLFTFVR